MFLRVPALLLCAAMAACASAGAPVVGEPAAAEPASAPSAEALPLDQAEPDRSCTADADCTVKNVGNCCGYYPACVNVDAKTFPEQVKQACEREGRRSICGFPDIQGCRCVQRRCEPAPSRASEVM